VLVAVATAAAERSQYIHLHCNINVMKQEITDDEIRQIQCAQTEKSKCASILFYNLLTWVPVQVQSSEES
jgi:hypothetical protein